MPAGLAFGSGRPRRRPYPFDMVVSGITGITGGTGLMLGRATKDAPTLIAKKPPINENVQPSEFSYSAQNPIVEQTFVWDDWSLGFGLQNQRSQHDRRYYYATSVDCSIRGLMMPGPQITYFGPATTDATNGVSHFFEVGGVLYALVGRYCLQRVSDSSWTISKDFGPGRVALDVVVTKQNGGSTTLAYVAMGDSELMYKFDGTTWTQHGTDFARAFCLAGRELYRANGTNLLSKVDTNADPWVAANWGAANQFRAGDNSSAINRLCLNSSGTLLIFKTDGIYVLDEDGNDIKLFTGLGIVPDSNNGKAFCNYENWTYVTYNDQFFRISAALDIEHIGPERSVENDQETKGYVSACVGSAFFLYAGVKNRDSGLPTLFKFGAWVPDEQSGEYHKIDAWHGDISDGLGDTNATVQALARSTIGADSGHERLYIGRASGKIDWFALPCAANPLNCTSYRFDNEGSFSISMPKWHGGYPSDTKHIHSATINGRNITATNFPKLNVHDVTAVGTVVNYTSNVLRQDLPTDRTLVLGLLDFLATQDSQTLPIVLTAFSVSFSVRPPVVLIWEFPVLCENGLYRRDGTPLRIGADRIRTVVAAMADTRGSCTVITPDETSAELGVIDYSEGYAWDDDGQQWRAALYVRAVETVKGTEILVA